MPGDLLAMLGFGAAWFVLSLLRPTTTYHLAPIIVVACRPFFRWSTSRPALQSVVGDVLGGAAIAVGIAVVLDLGGWARGGVLFGGTPLVESLVLIAATFVVLVAVGLVLAIRSARRRPSG